MTSLQQQLAAIAASSTNQLDLKAQRTAHGKSLLFDAKAAVSQDFDTLYQICLEGFHELCNLDYSFVGFSKNLFSEQSKTEERTQMTAEENSNLDTVIKSFLGLISGRLLLKPAVKAVEWLVRRFRIHEYNTEYTLLTFLPYHETQLFTTLLSIMPKTLPSSYRFLQPYIKSLENPLRHEIAYAASTNQVFFTAFNSYVLKVVRDHHQSTSLLSFWASFVTQALNAMLTTIRSGRVNVQRQREEDLWLLVSPVLNEGLTYRHSPEMVVACYMIVMVLVSKTAFDDKILDALLEAVVKSRKEDTEESGLVCLAVIAQERKAAGLPKSVLKRLLKIQGLEQKLTLTSRQCRVDRLAFGFVLGLLERHADLDHDRVGLISRIVAQRLFTDTETKTFLRALVRIASPKSKAKITVDIGPALASLFRDMLELSADSSKLLQVLEEESTDLETLELNLGQVLAINGKNLNEGDLQDVEMVDSDQEDKSKARLRTTLDKLTSIKMDKPVQSFLDLATLPCFNELSAAYTLALTLERSPNCVMSLPWFSSANLLKDCTTPIFLIIMSGIQFPIAIRSSAWRQLTKILANIKGHLDMQALLPFLLSALSDPARSVRRSAVECVQTLSELLKGAKKETNVKVWGKNLYQGGGGAVEWLSTEDAYKIFNSVLIPSLEEFELDEGRISMVLSATLNGNKSSLHDESVASDLRSALRASFTAFLSSHAAKCPLLAVKANLFGFIAPIGKSASQARAQFLLPSVREWFSFDQEMVTALCSNETLQPAKVDARHLAVLHPRDSEAMQLLLELLSGDLDSARGQALEKAFDHLKSIWAKLNPAAQQNMATFLLDLSLVEQKDSPDNSKQAYAIDVLRSVALSAEVLTQFLQNIPTCVTRDFSATHGSQDSPSARGVSKRKLRVSESPEAKRSKLLETRGPSSEDASRNPKRITVVMELVDNAAKNGHVELLKGLFYVLSELQHYKSLSNSSMVYLQSLTVGSLLSIVSSAKGTRASEVDTSIIRADLLVDCVRRTTSPQVQNSALLLISSLASWLPETVLHSVMPIFTYMGSTLLRQEDDYSAHVIDQTITCVVPPLAASLRKKNRNFVLGISELLLSFTAAFEHIPSHRRITLFSQLITTLGPGDSLAPTIMLLFDRHPVDVVVQRFVADMLKFFEPSASVKALKQTLDIFEDALQPKTRRQLADTLFGLSEKSPSEIEITYEHLLRNIELSIDNPSLRAALTRILKDDTPKEVDVRNSVVALVEKSIRVSSLLQSRKSMYEISRRVVIASLNLPPPIELVRISRELLARPDEEMKRTTLKAIQMRVRTVKQDDEPTIREYIAIMAQIFGVLDNTDDTSLKQLAVACVDQITSFFGKRDIDAILRASQAIAGPRALDSGDVRLQTMSLHCLASMVEALGNAFIPLAPQVLPRAFDRLRDSFSSEEQESLHNAAFALICSVLEHVAFIYTGEFLQTTLELSHKSAATFIGHEGRESRRQFYLLLSSLVEPRERFSSLERTWKHAVQSGHLALQEHIDALSMSLKQCPKSVVVKNSDTLFQAILQGFDLRNQCSSLTGSNKYSDSEVGLIEQQITNTTLSMVLKLNDATFRPFFVRFSEWALSSLPKKDHAGRTRRSISFYGFLIVFFDRLKSIVTSYSTYILEPSVGILSNLVLGDEGEALVENVLSALLKSFEHDEDDFWQSPSHFSAIATPLVSLLTSKNMTATIDLLIPAITALANAASSSDLHKELNTLIMQHLRSTDAPTRLAAVLCEQKLTESLGEEWLNLLAEMVPFIAELQEDDNEDVEKETQRWIKQIEDTLGESLDNMLQ